MNNNQIYIFSQNFNGTVDNVECEGGYTLEKFSQIGSSYEPYSFVMRKSVLSAAGNKFHIYLISKKKNEDKLVLLRDGIRGLETIAEASTSYGDFDVHLPENWVNSSSEAVEIEINDKYYHSRMWQEGPVLSEYKVTNDVAVIYKNNISFAQSLGLKDQSGWDFIFGEEGEFLYYIDYSNDGVIDPDFIFKEDGPAFEVSKEIALDLIKSIKPKFKFSDVPVIKFKKNVETDSQASFTDKIYNHFQINQDTVNTDSDYQFGDLNWFNNESYTLPSFPENSLYDNQESSFDSFLGSPPVRDEILDFEADPDLNLFPIVGTYLKRYDSEGCLYNRDLYIIDENKYAIDDWNNSGRKLDNYFTLNSFLYNTIELIKKFKDENVIKGSEFDQFMKLKTGTENYLNLRNLSDYFNCFFDPYILYSENCNVIQRKFHYFGAGSILVEWTLNHGNTLEAGKVFDPALRRIYYFNETFSYDGEEYSVVEFFPFQDFGMLPIDVARS